METAWFHVFGFTVQTLGSFNFLFLQSSEEKGDGAICSLSAKENPNASVPEPLPDTQGGRETGRALAPGTPSIASLPARGQACKASH
jgi:hypothetical protein